MMKHRILIVDNDKDFRKMIVDYLEGERYCTLQADNGDIDIKNIERDKPDLIILDIHMPSENGLDVCRKLKAQASTSDIPIIVVTGRGSTKDKRSSYLAGAKRYLVKPLELGELGECIRNVLPEIHNDNHPGEFCVLSE